MDHPTNDIHELLYNIALKRRKVKKDGSFDEIGMANFWVDTWRQARDGRFKGLFDKEAILEIEDSELKQIMKEEKNRVKETGVYTRMVARLGDDGTATSSNRKRTAKDREFDLRNQLFKL